MHEIDHIFVHVGKLGAVQSGIGGGHVGGQIAEAELAVIVVVEIVPILLNVHFVGIESGEIDAGFVIFFQQMLQKRLHPRAEIVHFRRSIAENDKDAVQARPGVIAVVIDADAAAAETGCFRGGGALVLFDLDAGRDFPDLIRLHHRVSAVGQVFAFVGKGAHARTLQAEFAFVIAPGQLFPHHEAEATGFRIAPFGFIVQPSSGFAAGGAEGRPQLQGREQAQFQAQIFFLQKAADVLDQTDIFVCIGQQIAFVAAILAILPEKVVERQHDGVTPHGHRFVAYLAQAFIFGLKPQTGVDFFIRILDVAQLPVAGQDEDMFGNQKFPLFGKAYQRRVLGAGLQRGEQQHQHQDSASMIHRRYSFHGGSNSALRKLQRAGQKCKDHQVSGIFSGNCLF